MFAPTSLRSQAGGYCNSRRALENHEQVKIHIRHVLKCDSIRSFSSWRFISFRFKEFQWLINLVIILLYILGFIPQTTPYTFTDLYNLLKPSKQLQRISIITVCIATASLWYAILLGGVWVQDRQNMLSHKRNKG